MTEAPPPELAPTKLDITLHQPPPPDKRPSWSNHLETGLKIVSLAAAFVAACFSTCTLDAGVAKFKAESEKALLETQQKRVEVAEKNRDGALDIVVTPILSKPGWSLILATIFRTNSGTETVIVHHVRFACAASLARGPWGDAGTESDIATWINTPVTQITKASTLEWKPLGPSVTYPIGSGFDGKHTSDFDSADAALVPRYQPDGVGIYMAGETMTSSHQLMVRFADPMIVGCHAEVEYSSDARTRTFIASEGIADAGAHYIHPFTNVRVPVCGASNWEFCDSSYVRDGGRADAAASPKPQPPAVNQAPGSAKPTGPTPQVGGTTKS